MSDALIGTARRLAKASAVKPRQSDLRRAVSSAYYAIFNAVAGNSADCFVGKGRMQFTEEWARVYRALNHKDAKDRLISALKNPNHAAFHSVARTFISLQDSRLAADYDPLMRLSRAKALADIQVSEDAINALRRLPKPARMALAVEIHFKKR